MADRGLDDPVSGLRVSDPPPACWSSRQAQGSIGPMPRASGVTATDSDTEQGLEVGRAARIGLRSGTPPRWEPAGKGDSDRGGNDGKAAARVTWCGETGRPAGSSALWTRETLRRATAPEGMAREQREPVDRADFVWRQQCRDREGRTSSPGRVLRDRTTWERGSVDPGPRARMATSWSRWWRHHRCEVWCARMGDDGLRVERFQAAGPVFRGRRNGQVMPRTSGPQGSAGRRDGRVAQGRARTSRCSPRLWPATRRTPWSAAGCNRPARCAWSKPSKS